MHCPLQNRAEVVVSGVPVAVVVAAVVAEEVEHVSRQLLDLSSGRLVKRIQDVAVVAGCLAVAVALDPGNEVVKVEVEVEEEGLALS